MYLRPLIITQDKKQPLHKPKQIQHLHRRLLETPVRGRDKDKAVDAGKARAKGEEQDREKVKVKAKAVASVAGNPLIK